VYNDGSHKQFDFYQGIIYNVVMSRYIKINCSVCGKATKQQIARANVGKRAVCSRKCQNVLITGEKSKRWKGGKRIDNRGYILVKDYQKDRPYNTCRGEVLEHRLVMEKHLGRYLKSSEIVHHIDENRQNNNIYNLMLFKNNTEHLKYHRELKNK